MEATKVQHTPGPWTVGRINHVDGEIVDSAGGAICFRTYGSDGEAKANANLIAAAPDLLAACRDADEALCGATWVKGADKRGLKYASEKIRAAIAKATGAAT